MFFFQFFNDNSCYFLFATQGESFYCSDELQVIKSSFDSIGKFYSAFDIEKEEFSSKFKEQVKVFDVSFNQKLPQIFGKGIYRLLDNIDCEEWLSIEKDFYKVRDDHIVDVFGKNVFDAYHKLFSQFPPECTLHSFLKAAPRIFSI